MTGKPIAEVIAECALSQERAMLDACKRIMQLEQAKAQALTALASAYEVEDFEQHIRNLRDQVKQYLVLNDADSLLDAETGIEARLQLRKGTPVYDVRSLVQSVAGQHALLAAAEHVGMVQVDHKAVARARKTGAVFLDLLSACQMPGEVSAALVFKNRGKWA